MDISALSGYMNVVIVGICLCVGYVLKTAVPGDRINRFIPLIEAALGLCIALWAAHAVTPDVVLTGMVSGLASTGLYEAFAQLLTLGQLRAVEAAEHEDRSGE